MLKILSTWAMFFMTFSASAALIPNVFEIQAASLPETFRGYDEMEGSVTLTFVRNYESDSQLLTSIKFHEGKKLPSDVVGDLTCEYNCTISLNVRAVINYLSYPTLRIERLVPAEVLGQDVYTTEATVNVLSLWPRVLLIYPELY